MVLKLGDLNLVWLRICQVWANSEWRNRMVQQQRWRGTSRIQTQAIEMPNTMTTISFFFLDLGLLQASFSKNIFYTSTKHINFTFVRAIYNSYLILSNMGNYVI